jgi:hypothetical protein
MDSASLSPRGLAAVLLAGLAMLLFPASASAQDGVVYQLEDDPQSSTISGSGRPVVHVRCVRRQRAKGTVRIRRESTRAAVFGNVNCADRGRGKTRSGAQRS